MLAALIVYHLPQDTDWAATARNAYQRALDLYVNMPGLHAKAFIMDKERGLYGGQYIWESRESFEAFQRSAAFQDSKKRFGEPTIQVFDVAAYIEGGAVLSPEQFPSTDAH